MAQLPRALVHRFLLAVLLVASLLVALPPRTTAAQETDDPSAQDPADSETPHGPRARRPGSRPQPLLRDELKVYVLTFTPGDHPFYKFGHNAIWIHDPYEPNRVRKDLVYNYGMFAFGDPALIPKFFLGRFLYWLEAHPYQPTVLSYKREGRGVDAQELDLTMDQKLDLKRALEENAREENKHYKYDYYQDNCATRVRDMVDKVTGGRVALAAKDPARLTWRQHTSRLTSDLVSEYVILNLVMGDLIDKPRTVWEESFIPMEFQKLLRKVTIIGEDGVERPIVKEEKTIVAAKKPPPPENPPTYWPYALVTGLAFGGLFALLGRQGVKRRAYRIAYGSLLAFFGVIWGFFGWFFLAAWAFTDHAVGYHNENVLLCVPWAFGLVGMGVNIARSRVPSAKRAYKLVLAALASAGFAVVAKVLPWFDQDNTFFLVFFVPFWAGVFFGSRELAHKWAAIAETAGDRKKKKKAASPPTEAPKPADENPKPEEAEPQPEAEAKAPEPVEARAEEQKKPEDLAVAAPEADADEKNPAEPKADPPSP